LAAHLFRRRKISPLSLDWRPEVIGWSSGNHTNCEEQLSRNDPAARSDHGPAGRDAHLTLEPVRITVARLQDADGRLASNQSAGAGHLPIWDRQHPRHGDIHLAHHRPNNQIGTAPVGLPGVSR